MTDRQPIVIWRFVDGKPGHEKQTEGLANAIQQLHACTIIPVRPASVISTAFDFICRRLSVSYPNEKPDLILGAGHKTHLAMLVCQSITNAPAVLLMKPSLPTSCFNLCIIPDHDQVRSNDHVLLSRGPINNQQFTSEKQTDTGLILLGGISRHYDWSETLVMDQINQVLSSCPDIHWTITDSRRTPLTSGHKLKQLKSENVNYLPHEQTSSGWLQKQLQINANVWVTSDSLSMMYEAVTAGCRVGILEAGKTQQTKQTQSIKRLLENKMVTAFSDWQSGQELSQPTQQLNEASRFAQLILDRFF